MPTVLSVFVPSTWCTSHLTQWLSHIPMIIAEPRVRAGFMLEPV